MAKKKTIAELAKLTGGRVRGDGEAVITGVASIEEARPGDIAFIASAKHLKLLETTKAAVVIVKDGDYDAPSVNLLLVRNPRIAFGKVVDVFKPAFVPRPGIHPKAEIDASAQIGQGAYIGPFVVIEAGAVIGERAVIYPGVYVGCNAQVGPDSTLYSGVAVREGCVIGARVIIHCNSVVGSDGFGYEFDEGRHNKLPQRGTVRIEDDVELGACVTVDRAALGETVIGRGTKVDNLVQIAHNVQIGANSIIVAQVGIAGSTVLGNGVIIGGQAGLVGHIKIGDGVMIGAQTGVSGDLPSGVWSGTPAIPHKDWLRAANVYAKLPELKKRIAELEAAVKELKKL
ncbi:MAG: UDP-3-O-(3-hydroxymyristoyl)glucosamine N-acyltransferase [Deltaproteobacteria bacterium RIFCSPLOWO2_02_FULL_53_8]|nr:MAG: UDP-3-O-(3-hydroxymyristoyl)glucosamine N-acyltransferase [Deltaproteobacteria bacterium RIFCSPLOWO2_02_FULL_53_8]